MARVLRLIGFFAPSAATFLLGTGALFLVDVWVGRMEAPDDIAQWALFKSLVLPLSTIALMGIDQVVVREPSKLSLYFRKAVPCMLGIAATAAFSSQVIGAYHSAAQIFFGTALLGLSGLYFGIFRANLFFNMAHIARDGWKPLLLAGLVVAHFHTEVAPPLVLIAACGLSTAACAWIWQHTEASGIIEQHDEISGFKSALSVSWPFAVAAFSLSLATYGEILLLKMFNAGSSIDLYFKSIVLFSYPSVMLNTYVVGFLSSFIRQRAKDSARLFLKFSPLLFPLVIVIPVLSLGVGFALEQIVFPGQETPLFLAALLSTTSGIRLAYTLLTSFIGTLGDRREIVGIALWYLALACISPFVCAALYFSVDDIVLAVATTALLHWLARGLVGWRLMISLVRRTASAQ